MSRGYLIPIGGAEEKFRDPAILKRFADICGGSEARIVIIPTASRLEETGPRYVEIFKELGVSHAVSLPFEDRKDCAREDWLKELKEATGVFITGGNQLRLSTTIGGTAVADMLRHRNNHEGLTVGGTSAGASILSEHMIAYGDEGGTPRCDMVSLAPGFGLTHEFPDGAPALGNAPLPRAAPGAKDNAPAGGRANPDAGSDSPDAGSDLPTPDVGRGHNRATPADCARLSGVAR